MVVGNLFCYGLYYLYGMNIYLCMPTVKIKIFPDYILILIYFTCDGLSMTVSMVLFHRKLTGQEKLPPRVSILNILLQFPSFSQIILWYHLRYRLALNKYLWESWSSVLVLEEVYLNTSITCFSSFLCVWAHICFFFFYTKTKVIGKVNICLLICFFLLAFINPGPILCHPY